MLTSKVYSYKIAEIIQQLFDCKDITDVKSELNIAPVKIHCLITYWFFNFIVLI